MTNTREMKRYIDYGSGRCLFFSISSSLVQRPDVIHRLNRNVSRPKVVLTIFKRQLHGLINSTRYLNTDFSKSLSFSENNDY